MKIFRWVSGWEDKALVITPPRVIYATALADAHERLCQRTGAVDHLVEARLSLYTETPDE